MAKSENKLISNVSLWSEDKHGVNGKERNKLISSVSLWSEDKHRVPSVGDDTMWFTVLLETKQNESVRTTSVTAPRHDK